MTKPSGLKACPMMSWCPLLLGRFMPPLSELRAAAIRGQPDKPEVVVVLRWVVVLGPATDDVEVAGSVRHGEDFVAKRVATGGIFAVEPPRDDRFASTPGLAERLGEIAGVVREQATDIAGVVALPGADVPLDPTAHVV